MFMVLFDMRRKVNFFRSCAKKTQRSNVLLMIGGDFNMIRYAYEKSTGSKQTVWMEMFNSFINDITSMELVRGGSRYTWTNKQENPIRSKLDRIMVTKEWGQQYPKVRVSSLTRVG
jgi:endonuclease/exonuclease/phosphatase family metal-dependent hydrolase